ncbi:MAG: metal-dependent hydrolase [Ruminococcaceae bacterium]|nr:metal-dependent hydrolase [Oscillospiraceae bacterium]
MIIDFHTHVFPDRIAEKTISLLSKNGGIPPFSDGTVDGLRKKMREAGTDVSVTLPVMTSPTQFDSINSFAKEINAAFADASPRLISFAGIHPDCENIDKKMAFIRKNGFLGVKLHPDYQGAYIDDERYVKILECAKEYDLVVVTHSGVDAAYRETVRCTPERALRLIRKVPHSKLVLAHMGANEMHDGAIEMLCGEDVYFDTAYVLRFIGKENFYKMLQKHGADRILFASDSPWSDVKNDVSIIKSFGFDKKTENKIFFENAKALLGI